MNDRDSKTTKNRWEISFADAWADIGTEEGDYREKLLAEGWKPFAVNGSPENSTMWFRRRVAES